MKKDGFTLVELLAVIVILAIVMLIVITSVAPMMEKGRKSSLGDEGIALTDAAESAYTSDGMSGKFRTNQTVCYSMDYLCQKHYFEKGCGDDDYTGSVLINRTPEGNYEYTFWISNGTYTYNAATKDNFFDLDDLAILYDGDSASLDCGKTTPSDATSEAEELNAIYHIPGIIYITPDGAHKDDEGSGTGGGDAPSDPKSLYNIIKNASLGSSSGIDYNINSSDSGTNGVYQFAGDSNVYFFRGSVNNNVIFGGYCWRIIRTTSSGGVKLLYSGTPSGGTCNNSGSAVTLGDTRFNEDQLNYVQYSELALGFSGYTYNFQYLNESWSSRVGNIYEERDSLLKTKIDSWYASNMTAYTSYLEDTPYCNDRTLVTYDKTRLNSTAPNSSTKTFASVYNSSSITKVFSPSLACPKEHAYTVSSSIGNGKLTYPVATITSDEIIMAGYGSFYDRYNNFNFSVNETGYLSDDSRFWTMTPTYSDASPYLVYFMMFMLDDSPCRVTAGARPVVSLKSGIQVESGDGSNASPYIIKTS